MFFLNFSFYISGIYVQATPLDTLIICKWGKFLNPVLGWQLRIGCHVTTGFHSGAELFPVGFREMVERDDTRACFSLCRVSGKFVFEIHIVRPKLSFFVMNDSCKTNKYYEPVTDLLFLLYVQLEDVFIGCSFFLGWDVPLCQSWNKISDTQGLCCVTHTNKYFLCD